MLYMLKSTYGKFIRRNWYKETYSNYTRRNWYKNLLGVYFLFAVFENEEAIV